MRKLLSKRKIIKRVSDLILFFVLGFLFAYGCPIYELWGIPCPCCGVTRAWLAFLQGKVKLAFQYHALFPVIPVMMVFYICYDWFSARWKHRINVLFCVMGTAIFVYALLRWTGFVDMP